MLCPALHPTLAATQRGCKTKSHVLLGFSLAVLCEGWTPKESELEEDVVEGKKFWAQIVPTDQDDPTSISQRSLQAALTAILDGLGILLLMEATWIPLASYSGDLRAFTGLSNSTFLSPNRSNNKNKGMTWNIPVRIFFTEVLHNILPTVQKNLQPSAWERC